MVVTSALFPNLKMSTFLAACIQNTATRDIAANITWVCERIGEAAAAGAAFITLPETVGLMEPVNEKIPENCLHEERDAALAAFRAAARAGSTVSDIRGTATRPIPPASPPFAIPSIRTASAAVA